MRKWIPRVAATFAVGLLLAACGSSSSTSSSSGSSSSGSPSGSASSSGGGSGNSYVLGTICSCSGADASSLGEDAKGIDAWVKSVNASGGINGHPVKMYYEDDSANPQSGLQDVKQLIGSDHVQAIIGDTSLVDGTWASYAQSAGVPVLGGIPNETVQTTNPDFFPIGSSATLALAGEMTLMKQQSLHHFGVLYCSYASVCAQLVPLAKAAASVVGGGIDVTGAEVSNTAPNYDAPCLSMKSAGVDALESAANGPIVVKTADQCAQLGYKPTEFGTQGTFAADWLSDANMKGAYVGGENASYLDTSLPAISSFNTALDKYDPGTRSNAAYSQAVLWAYMGGMLFQAAAQQGKLTPSSSPADIKTALYGLKNETLDGLAPNLTFTAGKATAPSCFFELQVKGGALTAVGSQGGKVCLPAAQVAQLNAKVAAALG